VPRTQLARRSGACGLLRSCSHRHFYDQIAWFTDDGNPPLLNMTYRNAGMFDFDNRLIPANSTLQLSWRISDHFPLWCEFQIGP
jgi:hypothetical protein